MILNDLSSMPQIGRAVPRVGVSLLLAASLLGVGGGQLVRADDSAPANVTVQVDGAHLPFIVCGVDTALKSGGHQSILLTSAGVPVSPAEIDPTAINQTFNIHGRSVADCGAGRSFKGLADRTANAGSVSLPAALSWLAGDRAAVTGNEMDALNCDLSGEGCTVLVPVATGTGSAQLQSVLYVVMEVTPSGVNAHSGRLLGDASALEPAVS